MGIADYIILFLLAAVLVVLIMGFVTMLRGKDPRRSNRLMVWRVTLQGLVILLAALFLAKSK